LGLTVFVGGTAFGYAVRFYVVESRGSQKNVDDAPIQRSHPLSSWSKGAESHLWKMVEYSLSSTIIQAADRLDLFERLYQTGPSTSEDLARTTSWSERWLREILLQLAGSGVCVYDPSHQTFALKEDYSPFLRGPQNEKRSLAGMFQFLSALTGRTDAVVQAVQTGTGIDYDYGSEDIGAAIDRKNGNFFRHNLVDGVLADIVVPQTGTPLVKKLEEGINVADVGCGFGTSTVAMAKRFPKSHFYAYESSPRALQAIKENIDDAKLSNVTICDVSERTVGDGPILDDPTSMFEFVYAHDVLHDMLQTRELIKDVKKRLSKEEGCWLIVDIDCKEKAEDNLRMPNAATLYAFSCLLCLSMATSEPSGEGLGTCGFPPSLAKRWAKKAGFEHFQQRKVEAIPYNAVYLLA
jgi:SAM-dependent methyltransferase